MRSERAPLFSVGVGNLTVGGTGKTPMVEYLIRRYAHTHRLATLSRGYGRATRGFRLADATSTARELGDEPLQYYLKFGEKVQVAVCEDRLLGAQRLHALFPALNLLLLDDAYQHRALQTDVTILLSDYRRPFYEDEPFPTGRLRETRGGARRADAVVVTKCPGTLSEAEQEMIKEKISQYTSPGTPVFFSSVTYAEPRTLAGEVPAKVPSVVVVAGIAQPEPFLQYARARFSVIEELIFPDHHNYSAPDKERLRKYVKSDTFVLTTEKDMVKLREGESTSGLGSHWLYVPIETDFGNDTQRFDAWLQNVIKVPSLPDRPRR
ncbi:tetraacyldisaccharide 4'-kinase [Rhabdobacter roseus]